MKKTVNITLGGTLFTVEEDAYAALKDYLDAVSRHFAAFADAAEIVADIETRIAERLQDNAGQPPRMAIGREQVEAVIAALGRVEDFEDGVTEEAAPSDAWRPAKRLFRNADDAVIAGVASGIAAYFGIEPLIVRLLFLVTVLFGGTGVVVYLVLWLIVPPASTPSQKLEMRGDPVTLQKLESSLATALQQTETGRREVRSWLGRIVGFIREIARGFERLVRRIVPLAGAIIGALIVAGAVAALTGIAFVAATAVFNTQSPYLNRSFPFAAVAYGAPYYGAVASLAVATVIPALFVLFFGLLLIRRRRVINGIAASVLVGIWIVAIVTSGVTAMQLGPRFEAKVAEIEAVGIEPAERNFEVSGFTRLDIGGVHRVTVQPGEAFAVRAQGRQRDVERLRAEVVDDDLLVLVNESRDCFFYCPSAQPLDITVTMPTVTALEAGGGTRLSVSGFESEELRLRLWGVSRAEIRGTIGELEVELVSGSRAAFASSTVGTLRAELSDVATLEAREATVREATVSTFGGSTAYVAVTERLTAAAEGVSTVWWTGAEGAEVHIDRYGRGNVRQLTERADE